MKRIEQIRHAPVGASHRRPVLPGLSSFERWVSGLRERLYGLTPGRVAAPLLHHLDLAVVGVAVVVAGLGGQRLLAVWRRRRLAASGSMVEVALPGRVERAALVGLFEKLAAFLPRRGFGVGPWVGFALVATDQRLRVQLFCSGGVPVAQVRVAVEAALPGASLDPPSHVSRAAAARPVWSGCVLVPSGSAMLPLRSGHETDPARQVLAALSAQAVGEGGIVQLIVTAAPRSVRRRAWKQARCLRSGKSASLWPSPLGFLLGVVSEVGDIFLPGNWSGSERSLQQRPAPVDPWRAQRAKLLEEKAREPLLAASVRLAAFAADRGAARDRLRGLAASFATFNEEGALRCGRERRFWARLSFWLPPSRPPLLLTAAEAAVLLPLPERPAEAPLSLAEAPARRLAPVIEAPRDGLLIGVSDREGFTDELRISEQGLLRHVHVLAPTGKGKSTLLMNLTLEAIKRGLGVCLIDPKGDLSGWVLNRIPAEHASRVDLVDLGDESYPPALNLLACEPGEADRQVEALLGTFRRLFSRYWGPRSEDLLRAALATLLLTRRPGDPAPTLADVQLLLDEGPRRLPVGADPVALERFWAQWAQLSVGQREQARAPLANKLRALLGPRELRNVLCQSGAPPFERILREGRVLICSLPLGRIGEDAGSLLGSILVHRIWQTAARLGPRQAHERPPFVCLIDEFHHFCHLPQGLASALAEARGYGLGFVLAHQNLAQLREHADLYEAIDSNALSKLCFGLPPLDAKRMEPHFTPRLTAEDLTRLAPYQLACRIEHQGRTLPAATCQSPNTPLMVEGRPGELIRTAAHANAHTRREVEALIRRRYGLRDDEPPAVGRGDADTPPPNQPPPYGPPFGPPSDGGPPTPDHRDGTGETGLDGNPDEDQHFDFTSSS